jgi:hypothetical protein
MGAENEHLLQCDTDDRVPGSRRQGMFVILAPAAFTHDFAYEGHQLLMADMKRLLFSMHGFHFLLSF